MGNVVDVAVRTLALWRGDILSFGRQCLGLEFEPWQEEALVGVQNHQRTAVIGSKGTGKTTVTAVAIWWYLLTREDSNVACTSVSAANLRDGLIKELALLYGRSPVLRAAFVMEASRIIARGDRASTWWCSFRTWSKSADAQQQADVLAGLHARHMMFCLDEAGSIPLAVSVTAEAALSTGPGCRLLLGGNPTDSSGPLFQAATRQRASWCVIRINGDPKNPKRSTRVDPAWAQQQIDAYGLESPWVKVNVLGEFPPHAVNALLGVEEVEAAMARVLPAESYEWAQKRLGCDVSRYGTDATIICPRQGLRAFPMETMRHGRGSAVSVEIANRLLAGKATFGAEVIFIDGTGGWGAGTIDVLRSHGESPIDVQFSAPAYDARYANRRSEIWWLMTEAIQRGMQLPHDPELLQELTTVHYTFTTAGRLLLEPKDDVRRRLGRSCDRADSLALTFGLGELPMTLGGTRRSTGKARTFNNPAGADDGDTSELVASMGPSTTFLEAMGINPRGGRRR